MKKRRWSARGSRCASRPRKASAATDAAGGVVDEPPAPAQHARTSASSPVDVGDVLEHLARPHDVDGVLVERQRAVLGREARIETGTRARARRSASCATSTATTSHPAAARSAAKAPSPAPRSSTRSPGVTCSSRNARRAANRSGRASSGTARHTASRQGSTGGNGAR